MELTSVLRTPESCVLVGKMTATGWIAVLKPKKIYKRKMEMFCCHDLQQCLLLMLRPWASV